MFLALLRVVERRFLSVDILQTKLFLAELLRLRERLLSLFVDDAVFSDELLHVLGVCMPSEGESPPRRIFVSWIFAWVDVALFDGDFEALRRNGLRPRVGVDGAAAGDTFDNIFFFFTFGERFGDTVAVSFFLCFLGDFAILNFTQ